MNFVCGVFLIHCEEHVAFWNVVKLFEQLEAKEIFKRGFPGLGRHMEVVEILMCSHLPELLEHMVSTQQQVSGKRNMGIARAEVDE